MRPIALAAFVAAACSTARTPGTPAPPAPLEPAAPGVAATPQGAREQTADQQVTQVLNRLAFGPRPGDVERVRRMGVDAWIDRQLHPERIDDTVLDRFIATHYTLLGRTAAELEEQFPPPGQIVNRAARNGRAGMPPDPNASRRAGLSSDDSARLRESQQGIRQMTAEVQGARVARAVASDRQLLEVMTDFWLNHFNVYDAKGPRERYMLAEYETRVIRPNALGRFRTLLGAVARSEAMLFYLDNWESQADSTRPHLASPPRRGGFGGRGRFARAGLPGMLPPMQAPPRPQRRGGLNENYGRELLELHTLGVDGGYTQADVIDAARALTGWTIRGPQQGGGFQFVPFMHDAGDKTILGHHLKAGRGIEDGEDLLDIVARHPSTAHFIAWKLARRFVSDSPSTALVDRAAAVFARTDGDIRETLRAIITSPEFFSRRAYRSKVKSPFEVVTSAARALGASPDPTPRTAGMVAQLGQPIYGHQAPNGWPETGAEWMNTGAILNRINFGMLMASGRFPGVSAFGFEGAGPLRDASLDRQVDGVVASLLGGDVSPDTRAVLVSGTNPLAAAGTGSADAPDAASGDARAGGSPDSAVGVAPDAGRPPRGAGGRAGRGGRGMPQVPPLRGLPLIVGLALGSPEFQRR